MKNIEDTFANEQTAHSESHAPDVYDYPLSPNRRPPLFKKRRWHPLAICALALVVAGIIFLLTGGLALTSIQRTLPAHTFSLNGHGTLVVNEVSGNLHIHPGSADQITVHGSVRIDSVAGNTNSPRVQYTQQGNTVTVTSSEDWLLIGNSDVTLDIVVPANIDIRIHTDSANALVDAIAGPITASASSGNLDLHNTAGALTLSTSSGDISTTDEQGPLSAHTTSGNISATGLHGPVDLSTTSGNITIEQAQISGLDHLHTTSGDISFSGTLDPQGNYRMETSSGNITLDLPATSAFQLSASSNSGELHNDFAADLVGSGPRARIQVQTSSGNISVRLQ
jgi:hypothetical protein